MSLEKFYKTNIFLFFFIFKFSMLSERADLKITVYHKSSIIDEFVGRVVISVADLFNENNKSFVK